VRRSYLIAVGLLLAVAVASIAAYVTMSRSNELVLPGTVEIQEVRLGSKVGGRIAKIHIREGDKVSPGQELVTIEVPELEAQRLQQAARLDAMEADYLRVKNGERDEEKAMAEGAKARYEKLKEGYREEEKRGAVSELETADAELKQTKEEWDRTIDLFRAKSASKAEVDIARGNLDRARGRINTAKAKVDMYMLGSRREDIDDAKAEWEKWTAKHQELMAGSRVEDIALAKARRDEAAAKLKELDVNLREAVVRVPDDSVFRNAIVEVLPVRPGDIVPANQPVVRLLCVTDLWVKTFVPETQLGLVRMDQKVRVRIDAYPEKTFEGVVFFRNPASEFTPRNVQSPDERRYQVFGLKIRVDDPTGIYNAGMAAEVVVPLDGPPR
jgi:HlyD family secretion protein